jgi:hypothetical protein
MSVQQQEAEGRTASPLDVFASLRPRIALSDVSQEGWAPYRQPAFFAAITILAQALASRLKSLQSFLVSS